jgi:hypothetical protein
MIIDNTTAVIKDRKMMYLLAIGLIIVLSIILFSDFFDDPVLGISREYYILFFCLLYILINVYRFMLNMNYIHFDSENGKISIKYYSLRPFMQQRKAIEIPKNSLIKFELKKTLLGLKESLILYQQINKKIAKYPPISIAALKKDERKNLIIALRSLAEKR